MNELLSNLGQHFLFRTYVLNSGLSKRCHHDGSDIIVHSLFNVLVDHVEVYTSYAHRLKEYDEGLTFVKPKYRWWKPYRDANAGVVALDLLSQERYDESDGVQKGDPKYGEPTLFSKIAAEQLSLYFWWKQRRLMRPVTNLSPPPWDDFVLYTDGKHSQDIETADFIPQTSFEENQRMVMQRYYREEDAKYVRKLMEVCHTFIY